MYWAFYKFKRYFWVTFSFFCCMLINFKVTKAYFKVMVPINFLWCNYQNIQFIAQFHFNKQFFYVEFPLANHLFARRISWINFSKLKQQLIDNFVIMALSAIALQPENSLQNWPDFACHSNKNLIAWTGIATRKQIISIARVGWAPRELSSLGPYALSLSRRTRWKVCSCSSITTASALHFFFIHCYVCVVFPYLFVSSCSSLESRKRVYSEG